MMIPVLLLVVTAQMPASHPGADTCVAAQATDLTMWPQDSVDDAYSSGPEAIPSLSTLRQFLSGTFAILEVTTEGVTQPTISHWRLWVTSTSPDATVRCYQMPCRDTTRIFPFVGLREDPTRQVDTLKLQDRLFTGTPDEAQFVLDRRQGVLTWATMPGWIDAGQIFYVAEITPHGFRGRWEDGSTTWLLIERDGASVVEHPRGYYCAFRTGA
jgi:hypothetical protein